MKTLLEFLINKPIVNANNKFVDLGLPSGTLWATCNLGAKKPEDIGDYYAWGETKTKNQYRRVNYIFTNSNTYDDYSKYNKEDKLVTLEKCDDIVNKILGNNYHIPTAEQYEELIKYTTIKKDSLNDMLGCYFISKKNENNFIFIPFSGFLRTEPRDIGKSMLLWTNELRVTQKNNSWEDAIIFYNYHSNNNEITLDYEPRCMGLNIRAVKDK